MKAETNTIYCSNQNEINDALKLGWINLGLNMWNSKIDIDLSNAIIRTVSIIGTETGNISFNGAIIEKTHINNSFIGIIDFKNSDIDEIYMQDTKSVTILQNYTLEDKAFLKRLPLEIIDMDMWHSDDLWKQYKTLKEINKCGTSHCIKGYAEVEYFIKHNKECEDKNTLYPRLKHMFYMTNDQFLKEREYILNS